MALCDECINKENCGVQEFFGEGKLLLSHCRNFIGEAPREIKTNFQRITATPEALADFIIDKLQYCKRPVCPICPVWKKCDGVSKDAFVKWLKQESE